MKKITLFLLIQIIAINAFSQNWKLKWADEFNGSAIDTTNTWNPEVNGNGGGNSELEYYRSQNLSLENYEGFNCMVMNAKRESYLGKNFTSARVNTLGKVYFQYGKIESRMKIPSTANGLWPAFWFMGNDDDEIGPRVHHSIGKIEIIARDAASIKTRLIKKKED